MTKRNVTIGGIALFSLLLAGCAGVLPTETSQQKQPWVTFKDVETAYSSVELGKTTKEELKSKGFNPENTSNIIILSYLDVVKHFSPILTKEDLPQGVQDCISAKENCIAYMASPTNITHKRVGNVAMDLLGFKKKTKTTGWRFDAMFVMVDGVVTYKLWSGTPDIEQYSSKTQPLGPAQNLSGMFSPN